MTKGANMVQLKGSEKQVKWATDIRTKMFDLLNEMHATLCDQKMLEIKFIQQEDLDKAKASINATKEKFSNIEESRFFIENDEITKNNAEDFSFRIGMIMQEIYELEIRSKKTREERSAHSDYVEPLLSDVRSLLSCADFISRHKRTRYTPF